MDHFEPAISLASELRYAYQVAAEIYTSLCRAADKKRFADAYQAQFKQSRP